MLTLQDVREHNMPSLTRWAFHLLAQALLDDLIRNDVRRYFVSSPVLPDAFVDASDGPFRIRAGIPDVGRCLNPGDVRDV